MTDTPVGTQTRPIQTSSTHAGILFVAHGVTDAGSVLWVDQSARVPASAQVTGATNRPWRVASSGDGQVLVAGRPYSNNTAAGYGYLFTSRDGGASWVHVAAMDRAAPSWADVGVSRDGTRVMAAKNAGLGIGHYGVFLSDDSGLTFEKRPDMGGTDVVAATLSGDGRTLMSARTTGTGASAVSKVYVSKAGAFADLGTTASLVDAAGYQSFTPPGGTTASSWLSLASSYDGTRLVAGGYHYLGSVFTSDNGGHSWVEEKDPARKPASSSVAGDADGWQVWKGDGLNGGVVQVSRGPGDGGDNYTDFAIQYTDQNPATPGFEEDSWTLFAHTPSTDLSRIVTGLESDTVYWFRVAQVNPQGQGPWSEAVSARTFVGSSAPGGVPQDLAALGGDREATVSWSAAVRLWSGVAGVPGAVTASVTPWDVAVSDDGQVVALGQPGGSVYVSTDGGASFVQQTALGVAISSGAWGVTVSGDGHTIMVGRPTELAW